MLAEKTRALVECDRRQRKGMGAWWDRSRGAMTWIQTRGIVTRTIVHGGEGIKSVLLCALSRQCSARLQRAARPLPAAPLAMPLPPLVPRVVPPRVGIPPPLPARGMPPLPLGWPPVLGAGAGVWGVWNREAILLLGGWSTKEVSVVRKVASTSSRPCDGMKLGTARLG